MELLENIFKSIWDYLNSAQFTALMASLLAIYNIVKGPFKKWAEAKTKAKIDKLENSIKQKTEIIQKTEELYSDVINKYNQSVQFIEQLKENALSQNEAMVTAFNNSNLNAGTKREIQNLLVNPFKEIEVKEPVKTVPTAIEKQKDEELPTQTIVDENKKESSRVRTVSKVVE